MSILEDLLKNMPNESDWFPRVMGKLDELVDEMEDGTGKAATKHVVGVLRDREEDLKGLSKGSFTLFVSYVAAGRPEDAVLEYTRKDATVDELVHGMLTDAAGVINAKRKRDELIALAWDIIKLIAVEGAKKLLPLLLLAL
jgi:hypothetical protein